MAVRRALPFLLLLGALVGAVPGSNPSYAGVTLNLHGYGQQDTTTFAIWAPPVRGLHPGATRSMRLVLSNSNPYRLEVTGLRGSITGTSKSGCRPVAANLTLRPYSGPSKVVVPAYGYSQAGTVSMYMPNSVVDACQGARFAIQFRGEGTKVRR